MYMFWTLIHTQNMDNQPPSLSATRCPQTAFEPSRAAALRALERVNPGRYARSRNFLDGAVTRLSPYVTHGLLSLREIGEQLASRHGLSHDHKLIQELGWREFFQHCWRQLGDRIFSDLGAAVSRQPYAASLPEDIVTARTGVPVIDQAVRTLYAQGYLHNHARMWLASYTVHLRKVHWRAGADWMYGHLLDGDLASNHLSWQWVAGTFSHKPYLFNAENVARYAPADWHSFGTVLDRDYASLDLMAREGSDCGPEPTQPAGIPAPPLISAPPETVALTPLSALRAPVYLRQPWDLACEAPPGHLDLGVFHQSFHQRFPWSAQRWHWVLAALRQQTPNLWIGDLSELLEALPAGTQAQASLNPAYHEALRSKAVELHQAPTLFETPDRLFRSFSQFWRQARWTRSPAPETRSCTS